MFGISKSHFLLLIGAAVLFSGVFGQDDKPTTTTTTTTTPPPTPPSTTTTQTPTTTTPTPKYPGNEGRFILKENNFTCIMMKGAIEISVTFLTSNNTNHTENFDVPKNANISGNCEKGQIELTWESNSLIFVFEANETNSDPNVTVIDSGISLGHFGLQNVTGKLNILETPQTPHSFMILNKAAFQTPLNHSYSCLVQEILKITDTTNTTTTIKLSDIRMEAFMKGPVGHSEFSAAIDCPADDASDTVPIAVGAALAGLVVIVLIAYLIGRRRSRARGYQSV